MPAGRSNDEHLQESRPQRGASSLEQFGDVGLSRHRSTPHDPEDNVLRHLINCSAAFAGTWASSRRGVNFKSGDCGWPCADRLHGGTDEQGRAGPGGTYLFGPTPESGSP
jgi:hypothetical protein